MNFFKSLLSNDPDGISSKRVCGILGWFTIVGIIIYCTYALILAPTIMDAFMFSCMGLLGIDSITNIWRQK